MTKNEKILIAINSNYTLASAMSAVFVNVYLYVFTKSLITMTVYSMIRFALFPLGFYLGGKLSQKLKFPFVLASGLILIICGLFYLLEMNFLFAQFPLMVFFVALFFGTGEGLFWCSVNVLNLLSSTKNSRARFISVMGMLNSVASIAAPLMAAQIVRLSNSDTDGYLRIFELVILVYALTAFVAVKLEVKSQLGTYTILNKFDFTKDSQWRYIMINHLIYGVRESVTLVLTGLLIYNATGGSGSIYGNLLAVFAFLSILAYFFAGKIITRRNRLKSYQWGSVFIFSSTIVMVLIPTIYGALYYGIVNALAMPFYNNPFSIIMMNAMQDYLGAEESILGRYVAKETMLDFGRVLGLSTLLIFSFILPKSIFLAVSVIFCSSFALILTAYATRYHNRRDKQTR